MLNASRISIDVHRIYADDDTEKLGDPDTIVSLTQEWDEVGVTQTLFAGKRDAGGVGNMLRGLRVGLNELNVPYTFNDVSSFRSDVG